MPSTTGSFAVPREAMYTFFFFLGAEICVTAVSFLETGNMPAASAWVLCVAGPAPEKTSNVHRVAIVPASGPFARHVRQCMKALYIVL